MTQPQTIFNLHQEAQRVHDGWVCGNAYRRAFIFSPHKRRGEMSAAHHDFKPMYKKYLIVGFEDRKCVHGSRGVRDYRIQPYINVALQRNQRNPRNPRNPSFPTADRKIQEQMI